MTDKKLETNAEQAKWIAAKKALDLSEDLGDFLGKVIGPSAIALGGILSDQLKSWRAANLAKIAQKWNLKKQEKNIPDEAINQLPFQDAYLAIEAASMEDDAYVQELWAQLLFSATKPSIHCEIRKFHIEILKGLNGIDARVLMAIFDYHLHCEGRSDGNFEATLFSDPNINDEILRVSLQNLQRLGVIVPDFTEKDVLNHRTFEEWAATVNSENLVDQFRSVTTEIISQLTSLTGSPMNDLKVEREDFGELVRSHGLTRIGFDLYWALYDAP